MLSTPWVHKSAGNAKDTVTCPNDKGKGKGKDNFGKGKSAYERGKSNNDGNFSACYVVATLCVREATCENR